VDESERQKRVSMATKVELVIRDEEGNILSQLWTLYLMDLGSYCLSSKLSPFLSTLHWYFFLDFR